MECINKKCWASTEDETCQLGCRINCVERIIKEFNNEEGNKVIKIRCINDGGLTEKLTIGKEYTVSVENENYYFIKADNDKKDGYQKHLFKIVEDDKQMEVKCTIDYHDSLTLDRKYILNSEDDTRYFIKNDFGSKTGYWKEYFEKVKEGDKQVEENRCYNEKCKDNDKNGICKLPLHFIKVCEIIDIKQPTAINYEEEYNKLKKENLDYSLRLNNQGIRIKTDGNQIQKLFTEIDSLKLKATVTEKLEIEIKNLNEIIERKDKELNNLKGNLQHEYDFIDSLKITINELKETVQSKNKSIGAFGELSARDEETIGKLNKMIESQNEQIERLGKATNEYYYNWIEAQKENEEFKKHNNQDYMEQIGKNFIEKNEVIEKLTQKNGMNEAYLITYEKIIKNQKEAIQAMIKLLQMEGKEMIKKEDLDKRICDTEEGAENTQTQREWIRECEKDFQENEADLDNMTEEELEELTEWLEYLGEK